MWSDAVSTMPAFYEKHNKLFRYTDIQQLQQLTKFIFNQYLFKDFWP